MLQTAVLLGGLAAIAQASAIQPVADGTAIFSRASPAIDCGLYPARGPSDHARFIAASGRSYDITCHTVKGASQWRYATGTTSHESCIAACEAGQIFPGCNYAAYYEKYNNCALAVLSASQQRNPTPTNVAFYSGAQFVPTLKCKDSSSNGTIYTPSGSSQKYQILCNYQYDGETLGTSKRAETFEQCVSFCDSTTGCVDVVYSDAKYCWLKKTKTNGYASGGWFSAIKVANDFVQPAPNGATPQDPGVGAVNCFDNSANGKTFKSPAGGSYSIKCNFQYDGATIASKYTDTLEQCANLCDTTTGCVDAIWSKAKYCWLKSSIKGNGYKSSGWFSAIKAQR